MLINFVIVSISNRNAYISVSCTYKSEEFKGLKFYTIDFYMIDFYMLFYTVLRRCWRWCSV